jgi:hypothetical protein
VAYAAGKWPQVAAPTRAGIADALATINPGTDHGSHQRAARGGAACRLVRAGVQPRPPRQQPRSSGLGLAALGTPPFAAAGDARPSACHRRGLEALTVRLDGARARRGWPRLGEPIVRHRGQHCYVSAVLPGHSEPTPILRLRYQGSADRWAIGIYLASSGQYTESELPTSFGPTTGTPEQGIDDTFALCAGPKTGR